MTDQPNTKTIEASIEIDAPPEAVWAAISDAEELRRWFPLDAEVEPGVGGSMTLSWGPDVKGTAPIEQWEEGKRIVVAEEWPAEPEPVRVATDYTIEAREGRTVLRVVNSGFSADDEWVDYLETMDAGWRYFLFNLKHYLERHAGTPRRMVWVRRKITTPKPEAWELLLGPGGLVPASGSAEVGAPAQLWSGHAAELTQLVPPINLACLVPDLDDALLLVELEPGSGAYSIGVWLSLYGVSEETAVALEATLSESLERLFGAEPVAEATEAAAGSTPSE